MLHHNPRLSPRVEDREQTLPTELRVDADLRFPDDGDVVVRIFLYHDTPVNINPLTRVVSPLYKSFA